MNPDHWLSHEDNQNKTLQQIEDTSSSTDYSNCSDCNVVICQGRSAEIHLSKRELGTTYENMSHSCIKWSTLNIITVYDQLITATSEDKLQISIHKFQLDLTR